MMGTKQKISTYVYPLITCINVHTSAVASGCVAGLQIDVVDCPTTPPSVGVTKGRAERARMRQTRCFFRVPESSSPQTQTSPLTQPKHLLKHCL